jgi:hypothetical protein
MSDQEIKTNLCYYDPENPNNNLEAFDSEDRPQPRKGCICENCFYGRDNLAIQILELQKKLKLSEKSFLAIDSLNASYVAAWREVVDALGEREAGDSTSDIDRVMNAIRKGEW